MFAASYLIGLREGLEMVLVVSVLVAYLVKTGRRAQLWPVWAGVAAAVVVSVGFGWLLTYLSTSVLYGPQHELFDAITSVVAVALVTWMIFWMRRTARKLSRDLRGALDEALGLPAVVGIAFLAVVREGLETTLLFFASAQGATTTTPLIALAVGLVTAVGIGVALYSGAVRIDLGKFFTVSGLLLVVVAAGIFKYAVHDFQEAGVLPGLSDTLDVFTGLSTSTWYGALLAGLFNITAQPSVAESIAWLVYLVPVLLLFLLPGRRTPATGRTAPENPAGAPAERSPSPGPEKFPHVDA